MILIVLIVEPISVDGIADLTDAGISGYTVTTSDSCNAFVLNNN